MIYEDVILNVRYRMAGVFVLLAFVLVVLVVGVLMLIICYQRSKSKQRQEEKEAYAYSGYGSQVIANMLLNTQSCSFDRLECIPQVDMRHMLDRQQLVRAINMETIDICDDRTYSYDSSILNCKHLRHTSLKSVHSLSSRTLGNVRARL